MHTSIHTCMRNAYCMRLAVLIFKTGMFFTLQGRARAAKSNYYLLVEDCDYEQFSADIDIFHGIENVSYLDEHYNRLHSCKSTFVVRRP